MAGDSAGYWIGPARLHTVAGLLLRGGGWALVVGRCTAGARVLLPGLAGMLGLRYRTLAAWTGAAATFWAAAHVLVGYAAGAGWRQVHQLTGRGLGLAPTVVVALAVAWLLRGPARGHQDQPRQPLAAGSRRAEAGGDEGEDRGGHRHRPLTTSASERPSLSTGRNSHADRP